MAIASLNGLPPRALQFWDGGSASVPRQPKKPASRRSGLTFADADGRVVRSTELLGESGCSSISATPIAPICARRVSACWPMRSIRSARPRSTSSRCSSPSIPSATRGRCCARFTEAFDKRLIGLGGTRRADQGTAAAALGVSFEKVAQGDSSYVVDHSSSYVLIDPSRTRAQTLRFAEPHLLAAKLIEVLTKAGVPLDNVNNVGAYR